MWMFSLHSSFFLQFSMELYFSQKTKWNRCYLLNTSNTCPRKWKNSLHTVLWTRKQEIRFFHHPCCKKKQTKKKSRREGRKLRTLSNNLRASSISALRPILTTAILLTRLLLVDLVDESTASYLTLWQSSTLISPRIPILFFESSKPERKISKSVSLSANNFQSPLQKDMPH